MSHTAQHTEPAPSTQPRVRAWAESLVGLVLVLGATAGSWWSAAHQDHVMRGGRVRLSHVESVGAPYRLITGPGGTETVVVSTRPHGKDQRWLQLEVRVLPGHVLEPGAYEVHILAEDDSETRLPFLVRRLQQAPNASGGREGT